MKTLAFAVMLTNSLAVVPAAQKIVTVQTVIPREAQSWVQAPQPGPMPPQTCHENVQRARNVDANRNQ